MKRYGFAALLLLIVGSVGYNALPPSTTTAAPTPILARSVTGPTGPTGPAWTTSAQLFSSITDETGSDKVVGSSGPTFTGNITGDRLTCTSTSGASITGTGLGGGAGMVGQGGVTGFGGQFTGGATDGGGNTGTPGVRGIGGSGGGAGGYLGGTVLYPGVVAENTTGGRAARLIGDTTSPARAALLLDVQDANPSAACVAGDLFMFTGSIPRTCAATTPIWNAVANMGTKGTVTATGTTQATATAITAGFDFYQALACDGTKGITLTQGGAGTCFTIMAVSSTSTNICKVYGHNSDNDTINGGAADAVYNHIAGASLLYCTADGTAWLTY